jgi:hypothetical protein
MVMRVKLEGEATTDRITGGDETGKGTELAADCASGVTDGVTGGDFVILACREKVVGSKRRWQ